MTLREVAYVACNSASLCYMGLFKLFIISCSLSDSFF